MKRAVKNAMKKIVVLPYFVFCFVFLMGNIFSCFAGVSEIQPAEYIVKINNIPMYSESAKSILRYINGNEENIIVYDNIKRKKVILPTVEAIQEGMDITVDSEEIIETISKLYESCFNEDKIKDDIGVIYESEDRKCMRSKKANMDVHLCVDKSIEVVLYILFRR